LPEIRGLGAELVVISPQLPAISREMHTQMKLGFDLLFDAGNQVAEAFGIAMQLPDDLIKVYSGFGIDLPKFDGDASWRLPVPARIVLAKGGAVVGIDADPDYTTRPEPEETLAVLRRA
jgi:peroxiredoxin